MLGSLLLLPIGSALGSVQRSMSRRRLSPVGVLALLLLGMTALGAVLLWLPPAQQPGKHIGWLDCFFTATSATTLTGMVTVSTADSWSRFGQVVILMLVQSAALAYVSAATIVAMLIGLRVGLQGRLHLSEVPGFVSGQGMWRVVRYVALFMLLVEAAGALALTLRFHYAHPLAWGAAAFQGIFYAIAAFCNTGFNLAPAFMSFAHPALSSDLWLLIIIGLLIILGGLGFGVITEVIQLPRMRRLSLQAKLVLSMTLILIVVGTLLIILFEGRNPHTLGLQAGPLHRIITCWFMAVTPRSAGFSSLEITSMLPPTLFILLLMMVIGGSPESTAGGVKVTTVAIVALAIRALLRRQQDIEIQRRRISGEMVRLALSLLSLYLFVMLLVMIGVTMVEVTQRGLLPGPDTMERYFYTMFQVVAAFSNVGMNTSITPTLAPLSRVLLMLAMLIGRVGPLAFVFVFGQSKRPLLRRLPTETVMAG